jgi:hypothetical protein
MKKVNFAQVIKKYLYDSTINIDISEVILSNFEARLKCYFLVILPILASATLP